MVVIGRQAPPILQFSSSFSSSSSSFLSPLSLLPWKNTAQKQGRQRRRRRRRTGGLGIPRSSWRWDDDDNDNNNDNDENDNGGSGGEKSSGDGSSFAYGLLLFNTGRYYECHDALESLWHKSSEPRRSILHGILQCSVALHHLLARNHRGAMVELGEGLNKLRRQKFTSGPFHTFELETSAVLDFLYNTQLEYAACSEDMCLTMDGSEQSYQLLGNFGAGKQLYEIRKDDNNQSFLCFLANTTADYQSVKLPMLEATFEDLYNS